MGFPARTTLAVTGVATATWALAVLLGFDAAIASGVVGSALIAWQAVTVRRRPDDPVDRARVLLGARPAEPWGAPVVALVLAIACLVAAVVRDDVTTALPALPLVAWAVVAAVVFRRALRRAEQVAG